MTFPAGDATMPFPLPLSVQKPVLKEEEGMVHLLKDSIK